MMMMMMLVAAKKKKLSRTQCRQDQSFHTGVSQKLKRCCRFGHLEKSEVANLLLANQFQCQPNSQRVGYFRQLKFELLHLEDLKLGLLAFLATQFLGGAEAGQSCLGWPPPTVRRMEYHSTNKDKYPDCRMELSRVTKMIQSSYC
jgi:hypothetical protein